MNKFAILSVLTSSILIINSSYAVGLKALDEAEMSETTGQALLYMGTTNGSDVGNAYSSFKYYKMGFQADIEANLNIKTLQLGCGGANGADGCDLDIENLSLTGVPTGVKPDGTPQWNYSGQMNGSELANERAASSAVLRNPFIEFAIKNAGSLATREVVGVRMSAEGIKGYMTAGTHNDTATSSLNRGGINTFSGYIVTDNVQASASTAPTLFGTREDQKIYAPVFIYLNNIPLLGIPIGADLKARRTAYTDVAGMTPGSSTYMAPPTGFSQWGINMNPIAVDFQFPQTVVTGSRMSQLNLKVDNVGMNSVVVSAKDGPIYMGMDRTVKAGSVAGLIGLQDVITNSVFFMGKKDTRAITIVDPDSAAYAAMSATQKQENLKMAQLLNGTAADVTSAVERSNIQAKYAALGATGSADWRMQKAATNHMGCISGGTGGNITASISSCTTIDNLAANVAVKQDFKRMHNLPVATTKTAGNLNGESCTQAKPCYDFNQGFYLGLQKEALRWPGSKSAYKQDAQTGAKVNIADGEQGRYYVQNANGTFNRFASNPDTTKGEVLRQEAVSAGDVAQRGWWMSFSEPLNFGRLEVQKQIEMTDVLPQVATFINNFFLQQATDTGGNPLYAVPGSFTISNTAEWRAMYPNYNYGDGNVVMDYATTTNKNAGNIMSVVPKNQVILGQASAYAAAQGIPLYVPLGSINVKGVPAVMELADLPLSNYQAVVPNCWGNLKFC